MTRRDLEIATCIILSFDRLAHAASISPTVEGRSPKERCSSKRDADVINLSRYHFTEPTGSTLCRLSAIRGVRAASDQLQQRTSSPILQQPAGAFSRIPSRFSVDESQKWQQ